MKPIYNCEFLEVAEGHKYLPKAILDSVELYRKKNKGELNQNPLIKEIAEFDVHYEYSDNLPTWRRGNELKAELIKKIENSDFKESEKVSLLAGLFSNTESLKTFREAFPYSRILGKPTGLVKEILDSGKTFYNEAKIKSVVRVMSTLNTSLEINKFRLDTWVGSNDGFFIGGSSKGPKASSITGKVAVNPKLFNYVEHITKTLSVRDLKYFCKIYRELTPCIKVPGKDHVEYCTKLPDLLNAHYNGWVVTDGKLEKLIYDNETREAVYHTLTFRVGSNLFNIFIN